VNRTTKVLLAVAGVVVLSYPGLAWLTGLAIEGRIQHGEQQALDKAPYLTLVSRRYTRGVYRSTEVATYNLHNPAWQAAVKGATRSAIVPPAAITVTFVSQIQHGPLPGLHRVALGLIDSQLIAPPALQKELAGALGSKPLLQLRTCVGFFGRATVTLTSPAFSVRLADGSTFAWGGLNASVKTTKDQAWSAQLHLPGFGLRGSRGGFDVAGITYSGSHTKAFGDFYAGTGKFTIDRVDGTGGQSGAQFAVNGISITSKSQVAGEFVDMHVDTTADAATIAGLNLKSLSYLVSFEHIHGPSLVALAQAVRKMQRQAGTNPTQVQGAVQAAFRQYGGDLLLHDPIIDIRQIGFSMPEGSLVFSSKLGAPGLSPADLQWPAIIMTLRTHAKITADLRVDNGLLQKLLAMGGSNPKVAAQLNSLEQQGYLINASSALTTHIDYSAGRLTLNGHPFPPAAPPN
jgi:uncharacterized protein YdgA (DUF945 family)